MANVGKPKHNISREMTPEWLKNKDKTYIQSASDYVSEEEQKAFKEQLKKDWEEK